MLTDVRMTGVVVYSRDLPRSRAFYEDVLGFHVIADSDYWVRYVAGNVDLEIRAAEHDGVALEDGHDETSLLVFLVADIDSTRRALEARSVQLEPTLRYEIGATAAFYDLDGHNITLYQPSADAMTWPSAAKIREIVESSQPTRRAPALGNGGRPTGRDSEMLGDRPLVYLFLFVRDVEEALGFYHRTLGLRVLEADSDAGVVKYDVGGLLLATHMVGGDAFCAVEMDLARAKGVAPVFEIDSLGPALSALAERNVPSAARPARLGEPLEAAFQDPNGHRFWLRASPSVPVSTSRPSRKRAARQARSL